MIRRVPFKVYSLLTGSEEYFFLRRNDAVRIMPEDIWDTIGCISPEIRKLPRRSTYTLMIERGMTPVEAIKGGDTRLTNGSTSNVRSTSAHI